MTTIGLIRHGVTDWNLHKRVQGQSDIPLNEAGRWQAERLAARLAEESWDGIVTSDLSRARETAEIVSRLTSIPILGQDSRLREISFGQMEGTTVEERVARWGDDWHQLELGKEPREAAAERARAAIEELNEAYPGNRVLAVSHGGLIAAALERLVPEHSLDSHLQNTSMTILVRSGDSWSCGLYNCALHLEQN